MVGLRPSGHRWCCALGAAALTLAGMLTTAATTAQPASGAPGATPALATGPFTVDMTNREDVRQLFDVMQADTAGVTDGWSGGSFAPGCVPGSDTPQFLAAALTRLNYYRAMAGVQPVTFKGTDNLHPDAGTSADTNNALAQAGVLMESANPVLVAGTGGTHGPPQIFNGQPLDCWTQQASDTTFNSNLAGGSPIGAGTSFDAHQIDNWINDGECSIAGGCGSDSSAVLGHRRNMLDPTKFEMGLGAAVGPVGGASNAALFFPSDRSVQPARDGFWAWPPKGFVPYQVVFKRWSFSMTGADFTNATVTMQRNGVAIGATIDCGAACPNFSGPGITWSVAGFPLDGTDWPKPTADDTYHVTVANVVVNGGAPQNFTYDVTVIDPSKGDAAHAPSGTASPPVGQNSTYTVPAIPNATGYQWRTTPLSNSTFNDGAENGTGSWTFAGGAYDPIQTTDVASGTHAFQLAQSDFNIPDTLALHRTLLPNANSQLSFDSKVVSFTHLHANVQVSTDGGNTWGAPLYEQHDGDEASFSHKTLSLAAYAGQQIMLRFAVGYDFNGGVCECVSSAWHFDNVALSNIQEVGTPVLSGVGANPSFAFNPPSAGTYAIEVRPQYSGPEFGVFSATTQVTATGAAAVPTVVGLVDAAQNAYVKSGTLASPYAKVAANATAISVGADATNGAVVGVIANGGSAYVRVGNGAFSRIAAGATAISVGADATNGAVVGVIANGGNAYVRVGNGAFARIAANATAISVGADATNGPVVGVIANGGSAYVRVGNGAFVRESGNATAVSVGTDATHGMILGLVANGGIAYVKQGTPASAWVKEASNATAISVASDATHNALVGVVANGGTLYVKQGTLASAWVKEASNSSIVSVASDATSGALLGATANGASIYVKQGSLTGAFSKQTGSGTAVSVAG